MARAAATVVIPCFNHGRFVRDAVASALAQRDADVRVVVVDDGSNDGSTPQACDAVAGDRVRVIHQRNAGLPSARNSGASGASTEYLVFLDADDWIEPGFVATLHDAIQAEARAGRDGDISHAYCQERLVERGTGIWRVPEWDPLLLMITNLHPVTALVRTAAFVQAGGFDQTMTGGYEDWDFWLRMAGLGRRGVRVREPLFTWRRHSPDTMIMNVVRNHEQLYRGLMERHADLYRRHQPHLLARSSAMLCQFEMNWLDEELRPINLAALKRHKQMYESMLAVRAQRFFERRWARLRRRAAPDDPAARARTRPPEQVVPASPATLSP